MIELMGKKKPVGRPTKGDQAAVHIASRVHPDIEAAIAGVAEANRRSKSTEIEIAIEERLLRHEAVLRELGLWTEALERLKPKPPSPQ
jgi:hypothetical protein